MAEQALQMCAWQGIYEYAWTLNRRLKRHKGVGGRVRRIHTTLMRQINHWGDFGWVDGWGRDFLNLPPPHNLSFQSDPKPSFSFLASAVEIPVFFSPACVSLGCRARAHVFTREPKHKSRHRHWRLGSHTGGVLPLLRLMQSLQKSPWRSGHVLWQRPLLPLSSPLSVTPNHCHGKKQIGFLIARLFCTEIPNLSLKKRGNFSS